MAAPRGNRNAFQSGHTITGEGYRRLSSGPNRHKYEHRVVMEQMLENPISYMFTPGQNIPKGMTVHHVDGCKTHNCQGNLMLISRTIHGKISEWHQRYIREHYEEFIEVVRGENRWE